MTVIAQRELRNQISALLKRAEQSERFTVTVDSRPVAELGPLASERQPLCEDEKAALWLWAWAEESLPRLIPGLRPRCDRNEFEEPLLASSTVALSRNPGGGISKNP